VVENAIRHGILKSIQGGTVTVCARLCQDLLELKVIDTGVGMTEDKLNQLLKAEKVNGRGGVAMININRRLYSYFKQSLQIESNPESGTTVILRIPVIY
jgi:two-component system sensor histidine kinase ChiS